MTESISHEDGKGGATTVDPNSTAGRGWGVFKRSPWDFVGIFETRAEAEQAQRQRTDSDYEVAFGTVQAGSDRFEATARPGET